MPRVPQYQPNQVGPVEITTARHVAANNNGGALGGLGEGLQDFGRSLGQFAEAQDRLNAENDDTQSRLLAAEAGQAYSLTTTEYGELQAGQAREKQAEFSDRLTSIRDDTLAKATNPRMKRFLEERLIPLHSASETQIAGHAIKEARVERNAAYGAQITSYGEQARNTDDPALRDQLIASAVAVRRDQLINMEGMDPDAVPELFSNEERKVSSGIHAGVLDKMFSTPDPSIDEIAHYLDAYSDEMTSDLKAQTMARLQKPLQDRQSRSDADLVMGLATPSDATSSVMGYARVSNPDKSTWDKRADGSAKGLGWLGLLQRPDGKVSSEISVGIEIGGKEREIPLMVPGLTKSELDYLMTHDPQSRAFQKKMPKSILRKAEDFAQRRIAAGKSPFRQDGEDIPATSPSSSADLDAITAHAESGGREYTSSGARVTSPAGARGEMQVMPETARDPGFGIKPSDGSPEEDKRVGRQYRAKMEDRYGGDLQKMWAAYNWGPGNVDKAIAAHGDNWLAYAPAETQRYVLANIAAAGGAGQAYTGQAKEWDRAAIYSAIDKTAEKEGWTPERTERARQEVDRRVALDDGLLKDEQASADEAAATILQQKGDSFRTSMIPPAVWARLTPTDKMQYQKIETELRKPKEPAANSDTVVALHRMVITDPQAFAALNLEKYRPFMTQGEFDELGQAQARAAKPGNEFDPRPKIDATISRQKDWSGIDVDKDATKGFRVRRYMEKQASAFRTGGKEPMQTDYDRWFGEAIQKPGTETHGLFGLPSWLLNRTTTDAVPQSYRDLIRRQFRTVNGRWPTEDETQDWFEKMGKPGTASLR